jgi:hypothetical protein
MITGKGVENNPHVIAVNRDNPELNGTFDIERVLQIQKDDYYSVVSTYNVCRMKPTVAGTEQSFPLSIQHTTHDWS